MWNEQLNITHIIDWYSSYHLPKQLQMTTKYCSCCFDSIRISTCSASMSKITVNDDIKAAKLGHEYYTLTLISVWYTAYLVKDFLLMTKAKISVTVVYKLRYVTKFSMQCRDLLKITENNIVFKQTDTCYLLTLFPHLFTNIHVKWVIQEIWAGLLPENHEIQWNFTGTGVHGFEWLTPPLVANILCLN